MLKLYNTLSHKKENFKPLKKKQVGLYTCGPTVYNYAHIGNLRTYVFEDILKRVLLYNNYQVKHVMNITDVGHLTSDADEGEDKMETGAKREGKTAWEIADYYTKAFKDNMKDLNLAEPDIWCKATDHIQEQIALVQTLIDKDYTYQTTDGIYFDTTKLTAYGKLSNLKKQALKSGCRIDIGEKKNPHDFALWKFSPQAEQRQMEWEAFGKKGFPGWHIECSAMSMKYLGEQFDIHCGGIDHIPIHHTNEIAQSETATDQQPWVKYWCHGEFLVLDKDKMAKSKDNFLTLETLKEKSISPLAYRYFLLQTHYRKQLKFTWQALEAAQHGLEHLYKQVQTLGSQKGEIDKKFQKKFLTTINDDLNLPKAMSLTSELLKSKLSQENKLATILDFDKILGLNLDEPEPEIEIPSKIQKLLAERQQARKDKDWQRSDRLRDKIKKLGFEIEDSQEGQKISKV